MRLYATRSLACLALTFAAAPAVAEDVTISVPYGDLDLTSEDAVPTIRARLVDAATEACTPDRWTVGYNAAAADCRAELVRKGMAEAQARREAALAELP